MLIFANNQLTDLPKCLPSLDLAILPLVTILSLVLLAGRATKLRYIRSGPDTEDGVAIAPSCIEVSYNLIRLLCTVTLLLLQLTVPSEVPACFTVQFGHILSAIYLYSMLLASYTMFRPDSKAADVHLVLVLLSTWLVFAYRDLWPLATYAPFPMDSSEGPTLWVKLAVLTIGAVVTPMIRPRRYVPYDPKNPTKEPTVEQTASILSRMLFLYMDPFVFSASTTTSVTTDELPSLSDSDDIKNLVDRAYKYLDPSQTGTEQHMFWRLFKAFPWEHAELAFMLVLMVFGYFLSPVGVNRLLTYVESGGRDAYVRPWVWAIVIGLADIATALTSGRYMLVISRLVARTQGVLTQLIFDHTMHMRMHGTAEDNEKSSLPSNSTIEETVITDVPDSNTQEGETETLNESVQPTSDTSTFGEEAPNSSKAQRTSLGTLNNLVASDIVNLDNGQYWLMTAVFSPFLIMLSMVFLYVVLGWSSLVGIATMCVLLPIPGAITKLSHDIQVNKMKKSDARVEAVTEVMSGAIRMVKMFGWETQMSKRIDEKREEELQLLRKYKVINVFSTVLSRLIPLTSMAVTFVFYSVVMKHELTASRVFSTVTVFTWLQSNIRGMMESLPGIISAKVSLDRIGNFLHHADAISSEALHADVDPLPQAQSFDVVGIRDAVFTWDKAGSASTKTKRNFRLSIEGEILFERGKINLIIGQTGSGKTSLLMALLGEMHYTATGPTSFVNLPRAGGVAYHAQESWILNETIRDNILFGSPYDETRYKKVIRQCALGSDLSLFKAGDETEVGEKGVTLSGGQKARVTLARAIYSDAEIVLLDDVFSALDTHTAQWIVKECLQGELVNKRTLIIATHNVSLVTPVAHFVVALTADGRISRQGSLKSVLEKDSQLLDADGAKQPSDIEVAEPKTDSQTEKATAETADGKLIAEEDILVGHVGWSALQLYWQNMASSRKGLALFWTVFIMTSFLSTFSSVVYTWILGVWARQYEVLEPGQVAVAFYATLYLSVVLFNVFNSTIEYVTFTYGSLHASRVIHNRLIDSALRSTLRWLDTTPSSRIIARCTQDISAIEGPMSSYFWNLVDFTFVLTERMMAIIYMTPIFSIPSIIVGLIGGWLGQVYIRAQLSVKRELSNARAPILGHFGSAVTGLVSIRAYGAQQAFRLESMKRINRYTRAARTYGNLNKWVSVRSEALAATFGACLAAYLVYSQTVDASSIGFTLAMAVTFTNMVFWWMKFFNEFEVNGNSLERIQQYLNIEHEPSPTEDGKPPAYWPASGELRVEKLSARYSENGPKVLHDISFEVKSGERIGIVGRTGSGKSSLTLALLRCILTEGRVFFDGLPTDQINLEALRSAVTIIPQVPELLAGTLRDNVDPFGEHDDAYLNEALGAAGLFSLDRDKLGERLTLDSSISSAGKNLSVGQRQMIAMARALVRRSRLLILDEATSAIDYETDAIIQGSLRKLVAKDVSLLTVAHRLQTIMDSDRIMVLDAGRIVEFGAPHDLLKDQSGLLYALVQASPDKDHLMSVIGNAGTSSIR